LLTEAIDFLDEAIDSLTNLAFVRLEFRDFVPERGDLLISFGHELLQVIPLRDGALIPLRKQVNRILQLVKVLGHPNPHEWAFRESSFFPA